MANKVRTPAFVSVTCRCGKALRAKFDQVGTEIRCWECQQMVLVPLPREEQRVARELSDGALVVIHGPGLGAILAGAAVVIAVMSIPYYGLWCSVIVLAMGASAYGEIIRRVSRGASDEPEPTWRATLVPGSIPRWVLCLLMASGTVIPLWILNVGVRQSPHFDAIGWSIAALAWIVLPLLMMMAYSSGPAGPPGVGGCSKLLARHPFATILVLSFVPASLALIEATWALSFYLLGNLPFFALDFMPMPGLPDQPVMFAGVPYYDLVDYRTYPPSRFHEAYLDGLGHGYSFMGAIPASLSMSSRAGMNPDLIGLYPKVYLLARVFIVGVSIVCLLAAFAIQARWLGLIQALEKRRPD